MILPDCLIWFYKIVNYDFVILIINRISVTFDLVADCLIWFYKILNYDFLILIINRISVTFDLVANWNW